MGNVDTGTGTRLGLAVVALTAVHRLRLDSPPIRRDILRRTQHTLRHGLEATS